LKAQFWGSGIYEEGRTIEREKGAGKMKKRREL
jgi:hypothetical protein